MTLRLRPYMSDPPAVPSRRRAVLARRLSFEPLESRSLLALAVPWSIPLIDGFGGPVHVNGSASVGGDELRLTHSGYGEVGSAWFSQQMSADHFRASFDFEIAEQEGIAWGDGFTFAIIDAYTDDQSSLGGGGAGLGYMGLSGLAIEVDTYFNPEYGDPSYPHVGVNVNGGVQSVATAPVPFPICDAGPITAIIEFDQGLLDVELTSAQGSAKVFDGLSLAEDVRPDNGRVGFTASTAAAAQTVTIEDFLLEIESPRSVESVINPANGHTYHLMKAPDESSGITWSEAEAAAVALGGHLVTINDAQENQWIADQFAGSYYPWIGLNDVEEEGVYVWSSGQPYDYKNWWPGEPNDLGGQEDYVHMYHFDGGDFQWNDNVDRPSHGTWPAHGIAEVADDLVYVAGDPDNFAPPTEPADPSPSLAAAYGPRLLHFDQIPGVTPGVGTTYTFAHTFADLPSGITGATLEVHVRAGHEGGYERTDRMSLGFTGSSVSWLRYFGTPNAYGGYGSSDDGLLLYPWVAGTDYTFFLDLAALPIAPQQGGGTINLIPELNRQGFLDVAIGDETGVDYLKLHLESFQPALLFRESDTTFPGTDIPVPDIPGVDHVALFPGGNEKVWESHPGYNSGVYWDPTRGNIVPIDKYGGVQHPHTFGSFWHNAPGMDQSPTEFGQSRYVAIDATLAQQMVEWIDDNANGAAYGLNDLGLPYLPDLSPDEQKGNQGWEYTCVGLIERAAEEVGHNNGEGFMPDRLEKYMFVTTPHGRFWGFSPEIMHWCMTHETVWKGNSLSGLVDPIDFIITDPLGRRLGHANGETYDEISDGAYSGDGELEMFLIADKIPGEYSIEFFGLGTEYAAAINADFPRSDLVRWTFSGYLESGDTYQTALSVPEVAEVLVNDGGAQRSMVTSLTVSFDQAIQLAAGAFELAGRDGTSVPVSAKLSPDATDVVLTFETGSLADGVYDLAVRKDAVQGEYGAQMAADYLFTFHRLFGDSDGDGDVDGADLTALRSTYGKTEAMSGYLWYFDADDDGDVDRNDYRRFLVNYRKWLVY